MVSTLSPIDFEIEIQCVEGRCLFRELETVLGDGDGDLRVQRCKGLVRRALALFSCGALVGQAHGRCVSIATSFQACGTSTCS